MPITLIDRNGPPEAMQCPAVICDACGCPISATGVVVWNAGYEADGRPLVTEVTYLHKGACDLAWSMGKPNLQSADLGEFMAQLTENFARPFAQAPGVEYVAPAPSTWRLRP